MRLYTFEVGGRQRLGAEVDGQLVDVQTAYAHAIADRPEVADQSPDVLSDMLTLIRAGAAGLAAAQQAVAFARGIPATGDQPLAYAFNEVRLRAPLPRPGKILCSGVNYVGHKAENPDAIMPDTPGFFSKLPTAVIGPGDPIIHPKLTQQLDYEVEFAVVLGRILHKAAESAVMGSIFGYTILHDVSARDIQFKNPQSNQITLGKNFDSFAPMGPCIVTADEVPNPANLRLRTLVNGEVLQDGSTSEWVFPLRRLLAFLSEVMTLEPGDVVTTGTPAGVGVFRKPQVFLQPGDEVVLEIEQIGQLINPVVAEE